MVESLSLRGMVAIYQTGERTNLKSTSKYFSFTISVFIKNKTFHDGMPTSKLL